MYDIYNILLFSLTYWALNGDINKLNDAFKAGVYLGLCLDF